MNLQKEKGFTIIEVILFLTLSSAFLMIAFAGIRGRTADIQFTDSMRSLQSHLVNEHNKVFNGVNSSDQSACDKAKSTGKNAKCILMGRTVFFGEDSDDNPRAQTSVLYGSKPDLAPTTTGVSDIEIIKDYSPQSDSSYEGYDISWGTTFNATKSSKMNGTTVTGLGWLRSPGSSQIIPIVLSSRGVVERDFTNSDNQADNYQMGSNVEDTRFCFTGANGKVASVNFDKNSNITLLFDDEECQP